MRSTAALGVLITILVIANLSNPGMADLVSCCRNDLPCCNDGRRFEREASSVNVVQQPVTGELKDNPHSNLVSTPAQ